MLLAQLFTRVLIRQQTLECIWILSNSRKNNNVLPHPHNEIAKVAIVMTINCKEKKDSK